MNKLFFSVVLSIFFLIWSSFLQLTTVFAGEFINSFYSIIEVNQDTSLTITEQIEYETTIDKHGMYRYIPESYNTDGYKVVLPIRNVAVTDELGAPIPFTQTSDGKFLTLKIGDPQVTFSGKQVYVITYTVARGINQFETHDELYWDITGEGWQFPIKQTAATVISKFAPLEKVACFSGVVGSDDLECGYEIGENQAVFTYLKPVAYGENVTIGVGFSKTNELVFPTQTDLVLLWIQSNWPVLLLPLPTIVLFFWWFRKGRDHEFISQDVFNLDKNRQTRLRPIQLSVRKPMVYEPLTNLTPGQAGALLDERVDIQDIVAEILELARKKYLKITVTEKKVLFMTTRDYEFEKIAQTNDGLSGVQAYLFTQLFKTGSQVKLSKLKGTFHTVIAKAQEKLESELLKKEVYTASPTKVRTLGFLLFFALLGAVFFLLQATLLRIEIVWPVFLLVLQIPFGWVFAYNLPQKTATGTNLWLQTRGLRATIKRGAWREKIKEKHLFIEEILPFAVSLGVVKQLAQDMEKLDIKPPDYIAAASLSSWTVSDFITGFSQEVGSSLSYNPSSSSSSGGSGFSGGFSGGGSGGGGGGSW